MIITLFCIHGNRIFEDISDYKVANGLLSFKGKERIFGKEAPKILYKTTCPFLIEESY